MTRSLRTVLVAVVLSAWALGCTPRVRGPVEPREDVARWPQIQIADRQLARRIAVRQPVVSTDEAGLLYVTVPVRSTTQRQITIEYKVAFFDRQRNPIQETTWFPKTMTPLSQETIRFNSTSNRADDFQLTIRPAK